jgi:hypothetical protein
MLAFHGLEVCQCANASAGDAATQRRTTDLSLLEVRALFARTHPGIVCMYDVGELGMQADLPSGTWAPCALYVGLELVAGVSREAATCSRPCNGGLLFSARATWT